MVAALRAWNFSLLLSLAKLSEMPLALVEPFELPLAPSALLS
jgi:hypothetical protein